MNSVIEFESVGLDESLRPFNNYRKTYGLLSAKMCQLPIVSTGFIVNGIIHEEFIPYLNAKYGTIVTCRIDAPFTHWDKLPRGKDIYIKELNSYYETIKQISKNFILLCFKHPSVFFTGNFIERWRIHAGINVLINWDSNIIIEYVGKGFDVGDLSRGTSFAHQIITIEWDKRNINITELWESVHIITITNEEYIDSRLLRKEILLGMNYCEDIIEENLPNEVVPITYMVFQELYRSCIKPVLNKKRLFNEDIPITIQINAYSDKFFHVYEIWESNT